MVNLLASISADAEKLWMHTRRMRASHFTRPSNRMATNDWIEWELCNFLSWELVNHIVAFLGARKSLTGAWVMLWKKSADAFMNSKTVKQTSTRDILRTAKWAGLRNWLLNFIAFFTEIDHKPYTSGLTLTKSKGLNEELYWSKTLVWTSKLLILGSALCL